MTQYNAQAIQAAIDQDPAIGPAEGRAIHALLKGRSRGVPEVPEAEAAHSCGGPVFGRLTSGCPRCDELAGGAAPRQGWGRRSRYDGRGYGRHSCRESNCGPICTWGDW